MDRHYQAIVKDRSGTEVRQVKHLSEDEARAWTESYNMSVAGTELHAEIQPMSEAIRSANSRSR